VTYQSQYFTIINSISECDHKFETRNAEPEIGTDVSSQTRRNPQVDGYGSGFGLQRVCGSGFWTILEPNRPVFKIQTRNAGGLPGPVANTESASYLSFCNCKPTAREISSPPGVCFTIHFRLQVPFPFSFPFHFASCVHSPFTVPFSPPCLFSSPSPLPLSLPSPGRLFHRSALRDPASPHHHHPRRLSHPNSVV